MSMLSRSSIYRKYKHSNILILTSNITTNISTSVDDEEGVEKAFSPGFSIKGLAKEGRPVYLDFQATTPTDPRVVDAMVSSNLYNHQLINF